MDDREIELQGLTPEIIRLHQTRVLDGIHRGGCAKIKIVDTCRSDNGGILPIDWLKSPDHSDLDGFVAFVPAAGAASRYVALLEPLEEALLAEDVEKSVRIIESLIADGAKKWALVSEIKKLIHADKDSLPTLLKDSKQLARSIRKPKALMPCTSENYTFLDMKMLEHRAINGIIGEVYIVSGRYKDEVTKYLAECKVNSGTKKIVMEQGLGLSTIRFDQNGEPIRNQKGEFEPVPAGHGTLVRLFPQCRASFKDCHSLFIRNIDNVMGVNPSVIDSTEVFLQSHTCLLNHIKKIRNGLMAKNHHPASLGAFASAETLAKFAPAIGTYETKKYISEFGDEHRIFFEVMCSLFQMSPDLIESLRRDGESHSDLLYRLYQRPVNSLGQVPNTENDIGGTPSFVDHNGIQQKLCVELPHITEKDINTFVANPEKATHFNPVFVAAEIPEDDTHNPVDNPYWILAKKKYRNQTVYYHETILYEILGSNSISNAVFVEIPRVLFNPHKSLLDTTYDNGNKWL